MADGMPVYWPMAVVPKIRGAVARMTVNPTIGCFRQSGVAIIGASRRPRWSGAGVSGRFTSDLGRSGWHLALATALAGM